MTTHSTTYLDHAASTTMRASAIEAWNVGRELGPVNASGSHRSARRALAAVDDAREALALVLGVDPGSVVFTSGGTESDNLAVLGVSNDLRGSVICSSIEHPAVLEPAQSIDALMCGVDRSGVVHVDALAETLEQSIGSDRAVRLVSVMTVNNEVGSVQPIGAIADRVRAIAPGVAVHTDAVQALSWVDLREVGAAVDLMSLSAHKFGGPHGVGALVVRSGTPLAARQLGGGQERERRSGTLNVAGIMAMAAAAVETDACRVVEMSRIAELRDALVSEIEAGVGDVVRTGVHDGDASHLAAGFAHLCFEGVENEALLFLLDDAGVAASAASACASGAQHPSHVLEAMGVPRELASGSLRLTLGHTTTESDIARAAEVVIASVTRLRRFVLS